MGRRCVATGSSDPVAAIRQPRCRARADGARTQLAPSGFAPRLTTGCRGSSAPLSSGGPVHFRFSVILLLLLGVPSFGHAQLSPFHVAGPAIRGTGTPSPDSIAPPRPPLFAGEALAELAGESARAYALESQQTSRAPSRRGRSVAAYTIGGAAIGAAVGIAILLAPGNCRTVGSMCGLGIPLYGGAGAVAGGLIGYFLAASSR